MGSDGIAVGLNGIAVGSNGIAVGSNGLQWDWCGMSVEHSHVKFKCASPHEGGRCETTLRSDRPHEIAVNGNIVLRPTCDKHKKKIVELTTDKPQLLITAGQCIQRAFETRAKADIDLAETALEKLFEYAQVFAFKSIIHWL